MSSLAILDELHRLDVRLEANGDRLIVDAPSTVMTDELRARLMEHKAELLVLLRRMGMHQLNSDSERAIREHQSRWSIPCYVCGGVLFWHREGGPLVCYTCHPPADEGIVYRRVGFEYVN